jgi:hypothetical protein
VILLGAIMLLQVVWLCLQLLFARGVHLETKTIQAGLGPSLRLFSFRGVEARAGLLPGAFVQFEPEQLAKLPIGRFVVMSLGPWLLLGAISLSLGAHPADFERGLTLLVRLPHVFAQWRSWNELLRPAPMETLARLAARLVSVNLLPLAPLAGGQVISRLMSERARGIFVIVSTIAMLVAMASGFL